MQEISQPFFLKLLVARWFHEKYLKYSNVVFKNITADTIYILASYYHWSKAQPDVMQMPLASLMPCCGNYTSHGSDDLMTSMTWYKYNTSIPLQLINSNRKDVSSLQLIICLVTSASEIQEKHFCYKNQNTGHMV